MGSRTLIESTRGLVTFYDSLARVGEQNDHWKRISNFCIGLESYPRVMSALSKLYANSILDFERALFCSWISVLVAEKLDLSIARQRSLYYAGLTQDVGIYLEEYQVAEYIRSAQKHALPESTGSNSLAHKRSYALVSYGLLEDAMPDDPLVSELVLHHHANEDGTGYPQNVGESQLSLEMQILITANRLCDSMMEHDGFDGLFDFLAQLKLSSTMFFRKVNGAYYDLLRQAYGVSNVVGTSVNALRLQQQIEGLNRFCAQALAFSSDMVSYEHFSSIRVLRLKIAKIDLLMNESGLLLVSRNDTSEEASLCIEALPAFLAPMDELLGSSVRFLPPEIRGAATSFKAELKRCIHLLQKQRPFSLFF